MCKSLQLKVVIILRPLFKILIQLNRENKSCILQRRELFGIDTTVKVNFELFLIEISVHNKYSGKYYFLGTEIISSNNILYS